jgi:hypothetical protein
MNMHVAPVHGDGKDPRRDAVVRAFLRDSDVVALGTTDLAEQRAGNRAILAARLEMIWQACEPHIRGVDEHGDEIFVDFRFVDLGARVLDRLGKVLQVHLPDPEVPPVEVVDRDPNAVIVSQGLDALEARLRGGAEGG